RFLNLTQIHNVFLCHNATHSQSWSSLSNYWHYLAKLLWWTTSPLGGAAQTLLRSAQIALPTLLPKVPPPPPQSRLVYARPENK
ncbi:MAG: hypothetical protein KME49_27380, partial [Brasilonema octagenarum HA4186-MV1]|nr:hypothetical protein [Brasilonema octagenarum HA4186-MV1]